MTAASDIAAQAARAGGAILRQRFGKVQEREKSPRHFVTDADLASEAAIIAEIERRCPGHAIMGEETRPAEALEADDLWIIDPLDATNNFAFGIPHFCVSVAYARRGRVEVGHILDPLSDDRFTAERGAGARLNGTPIRVATRPDVDQWMVATGFAYERDQTIRRTLTAMQRLLEADVRGVRRMGSAALDLAWVACGRFDLFFEYRMAPWDYAAGWLLVEEAGGVCRDSEGRPLTLGSGGVIAASAAGIEAGIALTAGARRGDEADGMTG